MRDAILALGLLSLVHRAGDEPAAAAPRRDRVQVVGLFSQERVGDLRALFADKLPKLKLVDVDFPNAEITNEYDPVRTWPGEKPERHVELLHNDLRNASRGSFGAKPARAKPAKELRPVEIRVAGLDCKGATTRPIA